MYAITSGNQEDALNRLAYDAKIQHLPSDERESYRAQKGPREYSKKLTTSAYSYSEKHLDEGSFRANFDYPDYDEIDDAPHYYHDAESFPLAIEVEEIGDSNDIVDVYLSPDYDEYYDPNQVIYENQQGIGRIYSESLMDHNAGSVEEAPRPRFGSATHQPMEGIPEEPDKECENISAKASPDMHEVRRDPMFMAAATAPTEAVTTTTTLTAPPKRTERFLLDQPATPKTPSRARRKSIQAALKEKEALPLPPLPPQKHARSASNISVDRNAYERPRSPPKIRSPSRMNSPPVGKSRKASRQPTLRKKPNFKSTQIASAYALFSRQDAPSSAGPANFDQSKSSFKKRRLMFISRKKSKNSLPTPGNTSEKSTIKQNYERLKLLKEDPTSPQLVPLAHRRDSVKQRTKEMERQIESLTPQSSLGSQKRASPTEIDSNNKNKQPFDRDQAGDIDSSWFRANLSSPLDDIQTPIESQAAQDGTDEEEKKARHIRSKSYLFSKEQRLTDLVETLRNFHTSLDKAESEARGDRSFFPASPQIQSNRMSMEHRSSKNFDRQKRYQKKQRIINSPPDSPRLQQAINYSQNLDWAHNWTGHVEDDLRAYLGGVQSSAMGTNVNDSSNNLQHHQQISSATSLGNYSEASNIEELISEVRSNAGSILEQAQSEQLFYENEEYPGDHPPMPRSLNELNRAYRQLISLMKEEDEEAFSSAEEFVEEEEEFYEDEAEEAAPIPAMRPPVLPQQPHADLVQPHPGRNVSGGGNGSKVLAHRQFTAGAIDHGPPSVEYQSSGSSSNEFKSMSVSPTWTTVTSPMYGEGIESGHKSYGTVYQQPPQYQHQFPHQEEHHGNFGQVPVHELHHDHEDISRHRRQRSSLEYDGSMDSTENDSTEGDYTQTEMYVGMMNDENDMLARTKHSMQKLSTETIKAPITVTPEVEYQGLDSAVEMKSSGNLKMDPSQVAIRITSPSMETFDLVDVEHPSVGAFLPTRHHNIEPPRAATGIFASGIGAGSTTSLAISAAMAAASSSVLSLNMYNIFSSSVRSLHLPFEHTFRESLQKQKKVKSQNTVQFASPLCQEISVVEGEDENLGGTSSSDDGVETASISSEESFGHVFGGPGIPPYTQLMRQKQQEIEYYEHLQQRQIELQEQIQERLRNKQPFTQLGGNWVSKPGEEEEEGARFSTTSNISPTNKTHLLPTDYNQQHRHPRHQPQHQPRHPQHRYLDLTEENQPKPASMSYFDSDSDTEWMLMDGNGPLSKQDALQVKDLTVSMGDFPSSHQLHEMPPYEQHEYNELRQDNPHSLYKRHPYHTLAGEGTDRTPAPLAEPPLPPLPQTNSSFGNLPTAPVGGMTAVAFGGDSGGESGAEHENEPRVAPQFTFPALGSKESPGASRKPKGLVNIGSKLGSIGNTLSNYQQRQRKQQKPQRPQQQQQQQPAPPHPRPLQQPQPKASSDAIVSTDSALSIFGQYADTVGGGLNDMTATFQNLNIDFVEEDEHAHAEDLHQLQPPPQVLRKKKSFKDSDDWPQANGLATVHEVRPVAGEDGTYYDKLPVPRRPAPPTPTTAAAHTRAMSKAPVLSPVKVKAEDAGAGASLAVPPTPTRSKMQTIPPAMAMTPALSPTSVIPALGSAAAPAMQGHELGEGFGFVFRMTPSPSPGGGAAVSATPAVPEEYGWAGNDGLAGSKAAAAATAAGPVRRGTMRPVPPDPAFGNFASTDEEEEEEGDEDGMITALRLRRRANNNHSASGRRSRVQSGEYDDGAGTGSGSGGGGAAASRSLLLRSRERLARWNTGHQRPREGTNTSATAAAGGRNRHSARDSGQGPNLSDENDERFLPSPNVVVVYIRRLKEAVRRLLMDVERRLRGMRERRRRVVARTKTRVRAGVVAPWKMKRRGDVGGGGLDGQRAQEFRYEYLSQANTMANPSSLNINYQMV